MVMTKPQKQTSTSACILFQLAAGVQSFTGLHLHWQLHLSPFNQISSFSQSCSHFWSCLCTVVITHEHTQTWNSLRKPTHWHTAGSACKVPRWSLHTSHTTWAERGCKAGSCVPLPSPQGAGGPGCCSGLGWCPPGSTGLAPSPGWFSGRLFFPGVEASRASVIRSALSALCPTSGHGARWTPPKTLCLSEPDFLHYHWQVEKHTITHWYLPIWLLC